MAETPRRSFRLGDVYDKARKVADSHGEELTPVVVAALEAYASKGVKRVRDRSKEKPRNRSKVAVPAGD